MTALGASSGSVWLGAVLAAALLLPPSGFALLAWQTRADVFASTGRELQRSADALSEYAARVFKTSEFAGELVNEIIRNLDDKAMIAAERALHERLKAVSDASDQIASVSVFDRDGHLLVASFAYPVPRDVQFDDREWMRVLRRADAPAVHISELLRGRIDGVLFVAVSQRRVREDAGATDFSGVVTVSLDPWAVAAGLAHLATEPTDRLFLLRDDAVPLVRHPMLAEPMPPAVVVPAIRAAMRAGQHALSPPVRTISPIDERERLDVARKVGDYPVHAVIGREVSVIDAAWRQRVSQQLALGVPAWLGLVALSAIALSRTRRARLAAQEAAEQGARRAAAEAAAGARARFQAFFESRAIGLVIFDMRTGEVTDVNDRALELVGQSREDFARHGLAWRAATPVEWLPRDDAALAEGRSKGFWASYEKEYQHADGSRVAVRISSAPLPGEAGRVAVIIEDISAQRAAEHRRDMLLQETQHRAKNILGVVQSILRVSLARLQPNDTGVADAIDGRIGALARSLSLASERDWASVDLEAAIRTTLQPFTRSGSPRVFLGGEPIELDADAVQPLSLALHELATNAAKYGALSAVDGKLSVTWSKADSELVILWQESGGPPIANAPGTLGFGSKLLRATIGMQLKGSVTKTWAASGLQCTITIPASWVVSTETVPAGAT